MYPARFDYIRPTTIGEVLDALSTREDCKLLAGGHSLLPLMKHRLATPECLIDLQDVPALKGISIDDDEIRVGALTCHVEVETSAELEQVCPLLVRTASRIGDPQVRNCGTIGGSLVHADPAADYPAAILLLEAEFVCVGRGGVRRIPAQHWFLDMMTTAIKSDEVLTHVCIRRRTIPAGAVYLKWPHPASGLAMVGIATSVTLDEERRIQDARLAVTGLAEMPFRAHATEQWLVGAACDNVPEFPDDGFAGISIIEEASMTASERLDLCKIMIRKAMMASIADQSSQIVD